MVADVIPLHDADEADRAAVLVDPAELAELRRLRDEMAPLVELARELAHARRVREEAAKAMEKVAQHERLGYSRIRVGAFARLRAVLEEES